LPKKNLKFHNVPLKQVFFKKTTKKWYLYCLVIKHYFNDENGRDTQLSLGTLCTRVLRVWSKLLSSYIKCNLQKSYSFQLRREARKLLWYFVWKITILCQKIIFSNFRGGVHPGSTPLKCLSRIAKIYI
jgi:hypothetical protein